MPPRGATNFGMFINYFVTFLFWRAGGGGGGSD